MNPISILNPTETVPPAIGAAPPVEPQNDPSPPAAPPTPTVIHSNVDGDGSTASVSFFDSPDELEDTAVGLAFAEEQEAAIIKELDQVHSARVEALKNQRNARDEYQKTKIRITRERINQDTSALDHCHLKMAALELEERSLKDQVQIISNDIQLTLQELTQERIKQEKAFFDSEISRLQSKQRRREAVEDLQEGFELAEQVYELKQRQWKLNQKEYDRIATEAEAEKTKVETQITAINGRLSRFQQFGVSRTTAGFLVHAGYASVAAVGALIAGFFEQRQKPEGDFLSRIIDGVRNLIGISAGGRGLWVPLFNLVLLIAFAITVLTLITLAMHWLIGKLDHNWKKGATRKRRTQETKGFVDRLKGFASQFVSLFSDDSANNQDGKPSRSRNRIAKDNQPVDRRDFVQFLAQMPYIAGAAIALFFLAALGLAKDANGNSLPLLEISSTYIGIVFLTLSASAAILYVTNVIEPRWRRYEAAANAGEEKNFRRILKLNWEFVVLVVALVASLGLVAFLGTGDRSNRAALGAIAISMSLASLGMAYGLVQRGLFKDLDKAESRRQIYRQQVDSYSQFPKLDDVFESFDTTAVNDSLRDIRLTQHKLDELRMLSELNKIFADDFPDDAHLENFLAQFVSTEIDLKGLKRRSEPIDPLDGKFPVAPEKIKLIFSRKGERGLVATKIGDVRQELGKLSGQEQMLNESLGKLRETLLAQELELIEVQQIFAERYQELERKHRKEIMKMKAAYRVGKTAYDLIRRSATNGAAA